MLCEWKKTWFRCEVGPFDPEFRRPFGTLEIGWDISDKPPLTPRLEIGWDISDKPPLTPPLEKDGKGCAVQAGGRAQGVGQG